MTRLQIVRPGLVIFGAGEANPPGRYGDDASQVAVSNANSHHRLTCGGERSVG